LWESREIFTEPVKFSPKYLLGFLTYDTSLTAARPPGSRFREESQKRPPDGRIRCGASTALMTTKHFGDPTLSPHQLLPFDLDENREAAVAPAHHRDDIAESDGGRAVTSPNETPATENPSGVGIRARYDVASFIARCFRDADNVDADCLEERRPIRSRDGDSHSPILQLGALPDERRATFRSGFLHHVQAKLG